MKKIIAIKGMSCEHCRATAEKALNAINGVHAKVDLAKKQATVDLSADIPDQAFQEALQAVGYEVVGITEKKGLFGR